MHLHPSTLTLSEYPTVGGGTADLVFTVRYAGDMRQGGMGGAQGPAGPPVVRLDVTGSEHTDKYRVTNIESNIGTVSSDIFEPYDFETETVRAKQGVTYTVRADVELVVEGFIPVYAIGFDGDIAVINVAASEHISMPYYDYVATQQDYLDTASDELPSDQTKQAGSPVREKLHSGDPLAMHSSVPYSLPSPVPKTLAESSLQQTFNATGTVMGENATGEIVPVHGIRVCVFDTSPPLYGTFERVVILNTTAGEPACGYTDASGRYAISHIGRDDPYDMNGADVVVSVSSFGYGGVIDLVRYHPSIGYYVYYQNSIGVDNYGGDVLVEDFNLSDNNRDYPGMAGAARIIDALSDGMAFFEANGQDPANLTVKWNYRDGSSAFPRTNSDGAFYLSDEDTIHLNGDSAMTHDDSIDRHTILHEFGHHVHLTHDPEFKQYCIPHYIAKKHDEACAWGEGWAQLVPHMVDGDAVVPYIVRKLPTETVIAADIDMEAGRIVYWNTDFDQFDTFESSGRAVGEKVEGSVAAAMWDMADDAAHRIHDQSLRHPQTGADRSSAGVAGLLDVFFASTYDDFADFYDRWEIDMRHNSAENVAILHGMSFSIPSNTSYYGFIGELDGVYDLRSTDPRLIKMPFLPNYVDISGDGSTIAVTSLFGRGLQLVDARAGEHVGLYAAHGYDHACKLVADPRACLDDIAGRAAADLGPGQFSSMDGIAFGRNSSVVLVSDGIQNRIQVIGSNGEYVGMFGMAGNSSGELLSPDGIAFLADDTTAAVADALNSRIQTFMIAGNGSAQHVRQFDSYRPEGLPSPTYQQLDAGPDGALYASGYDPSYRILRGNIHAAGDARPSIWIYPQPLHTSNATRIDDPSLRNVGGIAVDEKGLVYVSDVDRDRIRVYDPSDLRGSVNDTDSELGDRRLIVREVQGGTGLGGSAGTEAYVDEFSSRGPHPWQLWDPRGVAHGPPDGRTGDVRVYVADRNGVKMYEKDSEMPRVESVWSHTPDGTVVPGVTVEIAVNFSERVTVTGTPVLILETGTAGSNATYASGSGSRTLTFNYAVDVDANQSYIDYEGIRSLSLSGHDNASSAIIVDGSGNNANLTLPERGTAASLATNAALWIGTNTTDMAPLRIVPMAAVEAVEHQRVQFAVAAVNGSEPAVDVSYNMSGGPEGATISPNGTFTWTPGEADDGLHAFVVRASQQGDPNLIHARTFRILVAEDNTAPEADPVPNMKVDVLSELRFNIGATDADLPAQDLVYRMSSDLLTFAMVLPNGTFVWTPSVYDLGTTAFNVTVSDGFNSGTGDERQGSVTSVAFNVTVEPIRPSPVSVYALAPDGLGSTQELLYGAGQAIRIAVEFSERVEVRVGPGGSTPYLELLASDNASYRAPYDSGSGTNTLVFEYTASEGDEIESLSYAVAGALVLNNATISSVDSSELASTTLPRPGSPNSLSGSSSVRIDAVRPVVESIYAPDGNMAYNEGGMVDIAVMFSENVSVTGSPTIMLETGETDRDAVYLSGDSTSTLLFNYTVLAGDNSSLLDYTGMDALRAGAGASIRDAAGNDADLTLPAPGGNGSLSASARISIGGEGQMWTGEGNVTLSVRPGGISGTGNVTAGGDELRVTLHLGDIAPGRNGTAMFPPDGATVNATFATVTFPPSATATSVPADDRIVLYVVNRTDLPDNSTVQEAMEYEGSGRVVLDRVVEIGDEAGRINFDTPVRISLEGQANGRAFYIEGVTGPMMPIDQACAADDTDRVHLQMMDSMGECQLDSEDGDKVIYTYHLTRFGTVSSERDAPPPVLHTCSVSIDEASLGVTAMPGGQSPDAAQAVANRGSLPFDRVELDATPWRIDMGGAQPGSNAMSLPANVTEVREKEGGAYRMVGESGTFVAQGLDGGTKASLWFRVNLAAHGGAQSGDLAQTVAYLAECAEPAWRQ